MAAHPRPSRTRPQNDPTSNGPFNDDKFIELHPGSARAPRIGDDFQFNYLPEPVARTFKEALGCYSHGLNMAFAAMCRLTAEAIFDDLGEPGKLKAFDQADVARQLGDIDGSTFNIVRRVIFDDGPDDDCGDVERLGDSHSGKHQPVGGNDQHDEPCNDSQYVNSQAPSSQQRDGTGASVGDRTGPPRA